MNEKIKIWQGNTKFEKGKVWPVAIEGLDFAADEKWIKCDIAMTLTSGNAPLYTQAFVDGIAIGTEQYQGSVGTSSYSVDIDESCSISVKGRIAGDSMNGGGEGKVTVTCTYDESNTKDNRSYKVSDVPTAFKNLPQDGKDEQLFHLPYFAVRGTEHIQGYTQYQSGDEYTYFFTHNTTGESNSYLLTTTSTNDEDTKKILIHGDWSHCGGIQAIGKYLLIPCEKDNKSKVFIYDIVEKEMLSDSVNHMDANSQTMTEFPHKASCVGVTDFKIGNIEYYLLIVLSSTLDGTNLIPMCHCYISEANDAIPNVKFTSIGEFELENIEKDVNKALDCQGIGLVTDKNGDVYLIALHSYLVATTYDDWAFLFKITATSNSVKHEKIDGKHFDTKGNIGLTGTHFRYGAGIRIKPNGKLVLLATSKNIMSFLHKNKLDTNHWNS